MIFVVFEYEQNVYPTTDLGEERKLSMVRWRFFAGSPSTRTRALEVTYFTPRRPTRMWSRLGAAAGAGPVAPTEAPEEAPVQAARRRRRVRVVQADEQSSAAWRRVAGVASWPFKTAPCHAGMALPQAMRTLL